MATDFTEEWNDIFKRNNYSNKFSRLLNTSKPQPSAYTSNISPEIIPPELAFRICAIRETFEESGILLLTDYNGKEIVLDDPTHNLGGEFGTLQRWRDKINEDDNNFLKLFRFVCYCKYLLIKIYCSCKLCCHQIRIVLLEFPIKNLFGSAKLKPLNLLMRAGQQSVMEIYYCKRFIYHFGFMQLCFSARPSSIVLY